LKNKVRDCHPPGPGPTLPTTRPAARQS